MILGYIVTDRKMKDIDGFVEQVNSIEQADSTKPILVVGWKNAKQYSGYKSILDKSLGDNVYWTFSKSESYSDLNRDILSFYDIIYNNILNKITYYYINIFKLKYNNIKKLYNIVNSNEKKTIYISNNMLYIPYEGNILGISLNILAYCGIPSNKVVSKVKENPMNNVVEDNNKNILKLTKRLGDKKYALPYFID